MHRQQNIQLNDQSMWVNLINFLTCLKLLILIELNKMLKKSVYLFLPIEHFHNYSNKQRIRRKRT